MVTLRKKIEELEEKIKSKRKLRSEELNDLLKDSYELKREAISDDKEYKRL